MQLSSRTICQSSVRLSAPVQCRVVAGCRLTAVSDDVIRPRELQDLILVAPMAVSKMMDLLNDPREVIRNDVSGRIGLGRMEGVDSVGWYNMACYYGKGSLSVIVQLGRSKIDSVIPGHICP